ncbi:MAG TPA: efflux RND transporter periplasmic adaptor subunit [Longimicrobiales bacterium]|nr:efflux RND transporter periplasmic adaptor subunit [Longimicrobiales bacterium]
MKTRTQIIVSILLVAAAAVVAVAFTRGKPSPAETAMDGHDHAAMLAGMDEAQPVRLSEADARRIGVSLVAAELKALTFRLEAVGVATYDETRVRVVNPKVEGWVEHLHVDFNGAPVRAGQPLMDIYAPQLVSAQEELALAARLVREAGTDRARENALALLESSRRRLAYWDIPLETVRRVEETGEIRRSVTMTAPASGMVVEKSVVEGDRIMPGMVLYRIADLSRIWVEVDVFEKDLGLVREGQAAEVRFEAFPAETFTARVTYIYPTVSLESRTGRVRLELANPLGRLRPGMYAQVTLASPAGDATVVIPRSALLETGERALVFVEGADGSLEPREVVPGRTAGREVEILGGLQAGERVVSTASFLVDAESNLGALMDMSGGAGGAEDGGMDGMDHSGHLMPVDTVDHSNHVMPVDTVDHSGHVMPVDTVDHSNHMMPPDTMDHSNHVMPADTMDHSNHVMPADTMDHSNHVMPPDTVGGAAHTGHSGH